MELSLCEEILLKQHELEEVRSAERGRGLARAGDERTRIVKDRARRQLFAVADTAVPRATSDLAGRSKPFRMLGLPALFH